MSTPPSFSATLPQSRRYGTLFIILLVHISFFYALQSGLLNQTIAPLLNEAVITTIIAPEPTPPKVASKPQTKPVSLAKHVVASPPIINTVPSPQSIATPVASPMMIEPPTAAMPEFVPAPVAPVLPKTISSGIEYLRAPQPEYPSISKRMREEGRAVLRVLVNENGVPEQAEIQQSSGFPRLDEAARKAVMRALFKPQWEDGKAVPVYAIIPIKFQQTN